MNKENIEFLEKSKKDLNKNLKSLFSGQITLNFMLDIMYSMLVFYKDLGEFIQSPYDIKSILSGKTQNIFYILCEHIVGVHRSKTIFLTNEERSKLEDDKEYRGELMNDVYLEIKLRPRIENFIRSVPLTHGDRFLLFPVPYYLAVLESKFMSLALQSKEMPSIYVNIAYKSLAVLSLLQDNFIDCSYSTCRIIIEDYLRGNIFRNCNEAMSEYYKFTEYELKQSIGYPTDKEFLEKFDNRLNKSCKNKIEYLHYGWVDVIPHYHDTIKNYPYTFSGLKKFVVSKFANDKSKNTFELLDSYHNMCHGYAHGSISGFKYPILHYFEICSILANTTANAYSALCTELGVETSIDGVDIISEINKH